jgi:hypothetical protein
MQQKSPGFFRGFFLSFFFKSFDSKILLHIYNDYSSGFSESHFFFKNKHITFFGHARIK